MMGDRGGALHLIPGHSGVINNRKAGFANSGHTRQIPLRYWGTVEGFLTWTLEVSPGSMSAASDDQEPRSDQRQTILDTIPGTRH